MGLTDQPRADRAVSDFDPNDATEDAEDVGAYNPIAPGDPGLEDGEDDSHDHSGAGPGLTTKGGVTGGATDGLSGASAGSPNG